MEGYDFEGDERWRQAVEVPAGAPQRVILRAKHKFYKRFVVCVPLLGWKMHGVMREEEREREIREPQISQSVCKSVTQELLSSPTLS